MYEAAVEVAAASVRHGGSERKTRTLQRTCYILNCKAKLNRQAPRRAWLGHSEVITSQGDSAPKSQPNARASRRTHTHTAERTRAHRGLHRAIPHTHFQNCLLFELAKSPPGQPQPHTPKLTPTLWHNLRLMCHQPSWSGLMGTCALRAQVPLFSRGQGFRGLGCSCLALAVGLQQL